MATKILYKDSGITFYARIIRKSDSYIWNGTTFAAVVDWDDSVIEIEEDSNYGQYPVETPDTLPVGRPYDVVVYTQDGSQPENTDEVEESFGLTQGSIFGF